MVALSMLWFALSGNFHGHKEGDEPFLYHLGFANHSIKIGFKV